MPSFTDTGKLCPSLEFLMWKVSFLTLFTKYKLLLKFPHLQYEYSQILPLQSMLIASTVKPLYNTPAII